MEGDLVIIQGNEKNTVHLKTVTIHQHLPGSDNTTKAIKVRGGKSYLEQDIRYLHATKNVKRSEWESIQRKRKRVLISTKFSSNCSCENERSNQT